MPISTRRRSRLERIPAGQCAGAVALAAAAQRRKSGWRAAVDFAAAAQPGAVAGPRRRAAAALPASCAAVWDVHRHRIAPEVARQLRDLVADGRLEIVAGRIGDVRAGRGRAGGRHRGAAVALGPTTRAVRLRDQLHRAAGSDRAHARSAAAQAARRWAWCAPTSSASGSRSTTRSRAGGAERLWALGPLTKGALLGNRRGPRHKGSGGRRRRRHRRGIADDDRLNPRMATWSNRRPRSMSRTKSPMRCGR